MSAPEYTATVSGSFRRAMSAVQAAVYSLTDMGVRVLSPADPRVVDRIGPFLFVASDRLRSIGLVQQRHLAAIQASDLLWLVAPEGYVGTSAAMEVGFAAATGTPVYSATPPDDLTLRQFVHVVADPSQALRHMGRPPARRTQQSILIDPPSAAAFAGGQLEALAAHLMNKEHLTATGGAVRGAAQAVRDTLRGL